MDKVAQVESIQSDIIHVKSSFSKLKNAHQQHDFSYIQQSLEQQAHFPILFLGLITGSLIALAIGFALKATIITGIFLLLIPFAICYLLRKVYIHTMLNFQE